MGPQTPNPSNQNQPAVDKDQRYAEALVQMTNLDMAMESRHQPRQRHFLSKKKLMWIAALVISSIVSLFMTPLNPFASGDSSSTDTTNSQVDQTTKQLLNSANELEDINNSQQ
jgi:hypothetical protein